jgi:hypothetical protein
VTTAEKVTGTLPLPRGPLSSAGFGDADSNTEKTDTVALAVPVAPLEEPTFTVAV